MKGAIRTMPRGRATEPGKIPMAFWKSTSRAGMRGLSELFNVVFKTAKMSEE